MTPLFFVLSSPSGGGKSSLARALVSADKKLYLSISLTTRQPRPYEVDGADYHFVTHATFREKQPDFLESTTVFGHRYATLRSPIQRALDRNQDVLFDIDSHGMQLLKMAYPSHTFVTIYIWPPSWEVLQNRLEQRRGETGAALQQRIASAQNTVKEESPFYDYWVVNDNFDQARKDLTHIVQAARLRVTQQDTLRKRLLLS